MQKPVVFNRHLNRKWGEKENEIMVSKLTKAKPHVDMRCPESFMFYKTQFKKAPAINDLKEFELRKNNEVLVGKIMNIFTQSQQKIINSKKKLLSSPSKQFISQTRKWDLIKITQENQHLLKRLNDRRSAYNTRKWEDDYNRSQEYKKNICIFPSIKFSNPFKEESTGINGNQKFNTSYKNSNGFNQNSLYNKLKLTNFNFTNSKTVEGLFYNTIDENAFNYAGKNKNKDKKILYRKNVFLGELFHCIVTFYVENKKFYIEVEATANKKVFYIVFEDPDEISKIQKLYKKYEQIITDIQYDSLNDKVYISHRGNVVLNYISFNRIQQSESTYNSEYYNNYDNKANLENQIKNSSMKGYQQNKLENDKEFSNSKSEFRNNPDKNQPIVYSEKEEDEEYYENSAVNINNGNKNYEMEIQKHQLKNDEISENTNEKSNNNLEEQNKYSKEKVENKDIYLKESEKVQDVKKNNESTDNISQNKITIKNESIIKDPVENYNEVENEQVLKQNNNDQYGQFSNEGENPVDTKEKQKVDYTPVAKNASNKDKETENYISYNKAKEISHTLSHQSIKSANKNEPQKSLEELEMEKQRSDNQENKFEDDEVVEE